VPLTVRKNTSGITITEVEYPSESESDSEDTKPSTGTGTGTGTGSGSSTTTGSNAVTSSSSSSSNSNNNNNLVQQTGDSVSKARVSSVVPPPNAKLNVGYTDALFLSVTVDADTIKRVRFVIESSATETVKYTIRGQQSTYALELTEVPPGTYSWRVDVFTDSNNKDTRRQRFGPWDFTNEGGTTSPGSPGTTSTPATETSNPGSTSTSTPPPPPPPPSITVGLQSDCLTVDSVNFNICLDLIGPSGRYESWMEDFGTAKRRWESILRDDGEAAIDLKPYWTDDRDLLATGLPPVVDDIYISGFLEPYDGVGGVLGMAAPYLMKTDATGFARPVAGYMIFDSADESWLRRDGIWTNTIVHEMGHVLGLGTMWDQNNLHSGSMNDDKYRMTSQAQAAWEEICPGGRLPVETLNLSEGVGQGTAGGHWDEKCMVNELMTGFVNQYMPLSKLTVASLADMGYSVDYTKADPFGRSDLGDCGSYCPSRKRNLRSTLPPKSTNSKKKISTSGRIMILKAAAQQMGKIQAVKSPSLPKGMSYYAGEYMTVYIKDEDGDIKEETVSWSEAKKYAPNAINY